MRRNTGLSINALAASALCLVVLLSGSAHSNAQIIPIATLHGSNGIWPTATVRIWSGELYGTAFTGGPGSNGAVWKMLESGPLSDIASFAASGDNGSNPVSRVTFDSVGNLWGTTQWGGAFDEGEVWEILKGTTTIKDIADFHGSNGAYPLAGVTIGPAGNVFGTCSQGGYANEGVIWEITASSISAKKPVESVIAIFHGINGSYPEAGVTIGPADNLYGTCSEGGSANEGVVWEITSSSLNAKKPVESVIATFHGSDGSTPMAGVTVDLSGNLYGTASLGGSSNYGVVWEIPATSGPRWLSVLGSFDASNGADPQAGVTVDLVGNLWGTTAGGGTDYCGAIWEIPVITRKLSLIASFDGYTNGSLPTAGVTIDSAGNLIGTTQYSGPANSGVVWKVDASWIGYSAFGPAQPE